MDALTIITILVSAAAAGLVGSFALMRKMTLASDAMSHIALPGLALATLFGINPIIGATAALIAGALIVWGVEQRTKVATESIIGVVFSASLAIGALLSTREELLDELFGSATSFSPLQAITGLIISLAIIFTLLALKERLTLSILSPDIASTLNIKTSKLNLAYLIIFVITIILGLKFLGILLMGSLVIIPAATAKNLARTFKSDLLLSSLLSVVSVGLGLAANVIYGFDLGPTIITIAAGLFFISVFFAKNK
jgi:ABC-type Mn2+/Zn2+ transport system permease subunit